MCSSGRCFTPRDLNVNLAQGLILFVGGGEGAMSRMEILHHIVNHTTYHRGFVSDMLYQIPVRSKFMRENLTRCCKAPPFGG